jgi:hypothetical protein
MMKFSEWQGMLATKYFNCLYIDCTENKIKLNKKNLLLMFWAIGNLVNYYQVFISRKLSGYEFPADLKVA